MIIVHIQNIQHEQALEIVGHLLNLGLIYEPTLSTKTVYTAPVKRGKPASEKQAHITAKTRVFLFDRIASELMGLYPNSTPSLYATPIICMDERHTKRLKNAVDKA